MGERFVQLCTQGVGIGVCAATVVIFGWYDYNSEPTLHVVEPGAVAIEKFAHCFAPLAQQDKVDKFLKPPSTKNPDGTEKWNDNEEREKGARTSKSFGDVVGFFHENFAMHLDADQYHVISHADPMCRRLHRKDIAIPSS